MLPIKTKRTSAGYALTAAGAASLAATGEAQAHVKWFCAYDVAGQPQGLEQVLCANFEGLTVLALVCLMFGCLAEGTPLGGALLNALDRVTSRVRTDTELLVRATLGFFFVSLWELGGIILTPELKTDVAWIPWFQLALAAGLIWRRTMPLTGLGIVFLFSFATAQYGVFHLADYPIFLGVAVYLICRGLDLSPFGVRPLDIVRWTAAITLMWASIEKWAYPEWTAPLIAAKPQMTLGATPELFMQAAGVIEFTLAFALLWTPLVRRASAIILAAIFVSAVFEFGKVDAIGHSGIIVVLMAIAADDVRIAVRARHVVLAPAWYGAALALFLFLYYAGHAALFGGLDTLPVI
ncbi:MULTISPECIES: hypothetical protein [unclassified Methylobacterium]|uniref:hypothetical protein n=1 Tax=unclassified Methylobacterium TaxID=2615210 RepID=UPI0011C1F799|nr:MULTISPECIES: hypothetical protein [unclassified Methylobacterium]QEE39499.1 hypothetical protein FVA80_11655 [Methylobacterium sp. WL1]TXN57868.1 hypothetical protein FV241_09560 [Methylobacterium sp. WL2]